MSERLAETAEDRLTALRGEIARWGGLERWRAFDSPRQCRGCAWLDGRVFFARFGPYPALHPYCHCGRVRMRTERLSERQLTRLLEEARYYARTARALEVVARRRRG